MAHNFTYLINGSFDHTISPFDRGFAYGDGVFRTMKIARVGRISLRNPPYDNLSFGAIRYAIDALQFNLAIWKLMGWASFI